MWGGDGTWTAEERRAQRELREHIRSWIIGYRMHSARPWRQYCATARYRHFTLYTLHQRPSMITNGRGASLLIGS